MNEAGEALGKTLSETLRYSLAGITFLGSLLMSFHVPKHLFKIVSAIEGESQVALLIILVAVSGGLIYSIHRAVVIPIVGWTYLLIVSFIRRNQFRHNSVPIILWVCVIGFTSLYVFCLECLGFTTFLVALAFSTLITSLLSFRFYLVPIWIDITRWKNLKEKHVQHRLYEWASQIHLMYCVACSGLFALDLGTFLCWPHSCYHDKVSYLSWSLLAVSVVCHIRYLVWETAVFREERKERKRKRRRREKRKDSQKRLGRCCTL